MAADVQKVIPAWRKNSITFYWNSYKTTSHNGVIKEEDVAFRPHFKYLCLGAESITRSLLALGVQKPVCRISFENWVGYISAIRGLFTTQDQAHVLTTTLAGGFKSAEPPENRLRTATAAR